MYIVTDIGGTKMRVAASEDLEKCGEPIIMDTPQDYAMGVTTLNDAIRKVSEGKEITSIMGDITGVISDDGKIPLTAPHLPDWRGKPLAKDLESSFHTKAMFVNDTAMVGLGEAIFAAGMGANIVAYITVSTGVNGVRIVDGKIDRSAMGFEIGGQYLFIGEVPKNLEDLISGKATEEKYGKHPKEIEKDSPIWQEMAQVTAYGVHNTILHWSPDRVVLGGSMFNEIGIPVTRVAEYVQKIMRKFPKVPEIVHSKLGDIGGLYGGLAYLKMVK